MRRIKAVSRMFGGRKYLLKHQAHTRPLANDLCGSYKRMGYLTRVVKDKRRYTDGEGAYPVYGVYVRSPRSTQQSVTRFKKQ